jgi:predicted transcriptional regulator
MFREEVLANENRKKIYDTVKKHPGLHLRELNRRLDIPLSTLSYHLDFMVKYDLLERENDGHYTRYYVKGIKEDEKELLKIFRHKTLRKIILKILSEEKMKHQEILEFLEIPASTLSFYMNKLLEVDAVKLHKIGRENIYEINNQYKIARLLIIYRASFMDKLVDKVLSTWMEKEFSIGKKK